MDREQGISRIRNQIHREVTAKDEQRKSSMIASTSIGPQRAQSVDYRDLGLFRNIGNRVSEQAVSMRTAAAIPEGASPLQSSGVGLSPTRNGYDWWSVGSKPLPDLPDSVNSSSPLSSFSFRSSGASSLSTVAKILRHQNALERTLLKLKSMTPLSRDTSISITVEDAANSTQSQKRPSSVSNAVLSPISASASDFSLSRFPEPPPSTLQPPSPRSFAVRRMARKSKRKAKYFQSAIATLEDKISRHDLLAVPSDSHYGLESPVWQCDVTSFIDGEYLRIVNESNLTGILIDLTTPGRFTDSMYSGSDFTWRGFDTIQVSTGSVVADEQGSLMMLPGLRAPGELAHAVHDFGSTQPGKGRGAKGAGVKVRPRPPPIRVPGA